MLVVGFGAGEGGGVVPFLGNPSSSGSHLSSVTPQSGLPRTTDSGRDEASVPPNFVSPAFSVGVCGSLFPSLMKLDELWELHPAVKTAPPPPTKARTPTAER